MSNCGDNGRNHAEKVKGIVIYQSQSNLQKMHIANSDKPMNFSACSAAQVSCYNFCNNCRWFVKPELSSWSNSAK